MRPIMPVGPLIFRRWLVCGLAGFLLLNSWLAWQVRDLIRKGYPDFIIFYAAGKTLSRGLGAQLYDEALQYKIQQEFAVRVRIEQAPLPYFHPPFEAVCFVPLSWIPYFSAYLLWNGLNLVILLLVRQQLRTYIPVLQRSSAAAWLLLMWAYFPVFNVLLQGQDILLLLLLISLAYTSLKTDHEYAAGCWLGLGVFRPHEVLPIVVVLLLQKRRKPILAFLLVAGGCGLVSLAITGWHGSLTYLEYVWHAEERLIRQGRVVPGDMPNLHGLLVRFMPPTVPGRVTQVLIGLASLALIVLGARCWRRSAPSGLELGFSMCVITSVLTSYHAFAQDLSLLVLPMVLVIHHVLARGAVLDRTAAALLGPIGFLLLTPLQLFAIYSGRLFSLTALVLIFWFLALGHEISRVKTQAAYIDSP